MERPSGCGIIRRACPPRSIASRYASLVAMFEESFRALRRARRPASAWARRSPMPSSTRPRARFAAWLQSRGLKRGARVALMMPNVLQYPVAIAGHPARRLTVVNVNPLYKPRELEFQLNDSGAEAIVVLENFASVLQEALPHTQVKHVIVASMGDMLGVLKGAIVNFVVRHVKKMVPAYALPGAIALQRRARRRRGADRSTRRRSGPTTSPSCNIPAAPPASPRARCCCIAIWSPIVLQVEAWHAPMIDRAAAGRAADHRDRAAALSHLRAHRLFPVRRAATARICLLIPNPRDIGGADQGARQIQSQLRSRR